MAAESADTTPTSSASGVWWRTAPLRRAAAAGAIAGFVAGGVGSRVAMFLIAAMNEDRSGVTTDASATVGEFSISGTLGLLALGTVAGVLGGLVYLGLRRWLFVPSRWRGLTFGVLTLVTVGQPLFDPANVDFQIFEPVLVVIGLFAGLFLLNGVIVATILDRIHPEPQYPASTRLPRAVAGILGVAALLGLAVTVGTITTMIDDAGTCYSAAGGGEGCAVLVDDID